MSGRRILITGVGSAMGCSLASALERDPEVEHVTGIDTRTPPGALVFELSERVRETIQAKLYDNLAKRGPAFV